jgi:hypothetical protein
MGGGWQPISTAPRDGTFILLVESDGVVRQGRYVNDACRWFELNADWTDSWDGEIYQPTHWMSLPDPPEAA